MNEHAGERTWFLLLSQHLSPHTLMGRLRRHGKCHQHWGQRRRLGNANGRDMRLTKVYAHGSHKLHMLALAGPGPACGCNPMT